MQFYFILKFCKPTLMVVDLQCATSINSIQVEFELTKSAHPARLEILQSIVTIDLQCVSRIST